MRCRFCHARVAGRPIQCPKCGFYTGAGPSKEWDANTGRRTRSGWLRVLLVGVCALAVIAGVALRETGTIVSRQTLRYLAYGDVVAGLEHILSGDYEIANGHLELAIKQAPAFPEAHVAVALAKLAEGDSDGAIRHAHLADDLADMGLLDRRGALSLSGNSEAGFHRFSAQIICTAKALGRQELSLLDSRRLISLFSDLVRPEECQNGVQSLLAHPRHPAHRVLQRAVAQCPKSFRCGKPTSASGDQNE